MTSRTVEIGSSLDLHSGIYGSLLTDPPARTRYRVCAPDHVFIRELGIGEPHGKRFRPSSDFALAEAIDPGPDKVLFHSYRWPVLNRSSWIVDLDDFGASVMFGRSAVDPRQRRKFARGRSPRARRAMLERSARMLAAYTHPSCKAILSMTEQGIVEAYQWLQLLSTPDVTRLFLERCHIVPGAHRPLDHAEVRRKWRDDPLTVAFCGRNYHQKNGRLALKVLMSLARQFPTARFHYIGEAPRDALTRRFDSLRNTSFHGPLPRAQALRVIAASHILFHPSFFENFGMVYAEAMAAGLAIVTSSGPEMGHLDEFLGEDGAVIVPLHQNDAARDQRLFGRALSALLTDRNAAAAMASTNYRCATNGVLSVRRRNMSLEKIYRRAATTGAAPLRIEDLGNGQSLSRVVRLTAAAVEKDRERLRTITAGAPSTALLTVS